MEFLDRTLKDGSRLVYAWFEAMHTRMDIVIWDGTLSESEIHAFCRRVYDETVRIEEMASCFLPGSEITILNSVCAGESVPLTEELYGILARCMEYNRSTDRLFDVAASEDTAGIGLDEKLLLDESDHSAVRLDSRVRLNLSGYLKGYALDRATDILRSEGIVNALVSFGSSSVCAIGDHPGGKGWPVATSSGDEYVLVNECLTTSGNDSNDRRHIINPVTGKYVEGKSMVSVCTSTAEEGEVMATVSFLKHDMNN